MNKDIISIGWLRWLYGLHLDTAEEMVLSIGASFNSELDYIDYHQIYTLANLEKIRNETITKINDTTSKHKEIVIRKDGSKIELPISYSKENAIISWFSSCVDAKKILQRAYLESCDSIYIDRMVPSHYQPKWVFEYETKQIELFRATLLDTSNVKIKTAVIYLYTKGFSLPSKQKADSRPNNILKIDRIKNIINSHENLSLKPYEQWQALSSSCFNKKTERKAYEIILAKYENKSHTEAYNIVFGPTDNPEYAKKQINRYKEHALKLAYQQALPLPSWQSS